MEPVFVDFEIVPQTKTTPAQLRELCVLSSTDTLMHLHKVNLYSTSQQRELIEVIQQMFLDYCPIGWATAFDNYVLQGMSETLLKAPLVQPNVLDYQIFYGQLRQTPNRIALRRACQAEGIQLPSNMRFHTADADTWALRTLVHKTLNLNPQDPQYFETLENHIIDYQLRNLPKEQAL